MLDHDTDGLPVTLSIVESIGVQVVRNHLPGTRTTCFHVVPGNALWEFVVDFHHRKHSRIGAIQGLVLTRVDFNETESQWSYQYAN